jgi:sarcosine oxidase
MRFDGDVLHQPDGGRIASARAWAVLAEQVERHGGQVRWHTPVLAVEPHGDGARVVTADRTLDARTVVMAAGAWLAGGLGRSLGLDIPPLVVTQESAFHYAARDPHPWPSFIHHGATFVYGLETPGEGVKVAEHHTGPEVTPETRDFEVSDASRARVTEFVARWLPGLGPEPVDAVTCLYTSTATEDFVLDRAGPIVVASPCSGHGFKFAPLIGELVADLVDGAGTIDRFARGANPRVPAR